jgi:hypothetical protein
LFRRIAARRGHKRAILAVAHAMLVIAYHLLKRKEDYKELGVNYFDHLNAEACGAPWCGGWNGWGTW